MHCDERGEEQTLTGQHSDILSCRTPAGGPASWSLQGEARFLTL